MTIDRNNDTHTPVNHGNQISAATAERPLAGTVICCTSVAPEVRTRLAECAQQMGAEHKLDLTSDVTHLLVGESDTLKYKYVAKERPDVVVLRPDWVDAVRDRWMNAAAIDLDALAEEYRLPTLFGLKICITGFDDLGFRAGLQKHVIENGGEYTGDLTKDVTHLIAAKPEGKKYEYGTQWQKKVVSLKWYKDTLARRMQLDESLYHPSISIDEQGVGACKRVAPQPQLGKHPREDNAGPEPARKLRRTASARLGSQSDNIWTDIVTGGGFESSVPEKAHLRPSKSLPEIRLDSNQLTIQPDQLAHEGPSTVSIGSGYLDGKYFMIDGFERTQHDKLQQIILAHGGTVLSTLRRLNDAAPSEKSIKIMIVPYTTPSEQVKSIAAAADSLVVSEFWLEWCMFARSYVPPQRYPLGSIFSQARSSGFSRLRINVTGFPGIQTLHISKLLKLMGAQYDEIFSTDTSVLVCKESCDNLLKLELAGDWQIPVVSETWLAAGLHDNRSMPFEKYLVKTKHKSKLQRHSAAERPESHDSTARQGTAKNARALFKPEALLENRRPGSDFLVHEDAVRPAYEKRVQPNPMAASEAAGESGRETSVLREISPNSPTKKTNALEAKPKKRLFRNLDGPGSTPPRRAEDGNDGEPCNVTFQARSAVEEPQKQDIAGDIRDFYNMRANSIAANGRIVDKSPKKARLLGRALSNLSNTSSTSRARQSRASSVDSINTDGVGSEIAPVTSGIGKSQDGPEARSLTGRAKLRLLEEASASIELEDPSLYTETVPVEERAPQMTQLVYDDPEDTIALREKLAARRRQRSRSSQKQIDPKPGQLKEPKRIRDDDMIANAGWGAGRRTRHKDKSPPGFKDF